jgi:hypothetical protein
MHTVRPEVLVFMRAAETLIKRASGNGVALFDEEASEVAICLK